MINEGIDSYDADMNLTNLVKDMKKREKDEV